MTALEAVAVYLPEQRIPIEDLADRLGLSPMQVKVFRRYHKLGEVYLELVCVPFPLYDKSARANSIPGLHHEGEKLCDSGVGGQKETRSY